MKSKQVLAIKNATSESFIFLKFLFLFMFAGRKNTESEHEQPR